VDKIDLKISDSTVHGAGAARALKKMSACCQHTHDAFGEVMDFDSMMLRRYPLGAPALPSAGGMMSLSGGASARPPMALSAPPADMLPGITSTGYGFADIGTSAGNDVDAQYIQYMSAMREGVAARKVAAAERLARLQEAEENSETARLLKILENPVPDRNPTSAGAQMYGAWVRETSRPVQKKTKTLLEVPAAEDVWGHATENHRKALMAAAVNGAKAGTSQYRNMERPVEQEWTGGGSGQGSIAPKWDRPSFLLERQDADVLPFAPRQVKPGGPAPSFRAFESTSDDILRSEGLTVDMTGAPSMYAVACGSAVLQPSIKAPLRDQVAPARAPLGAGKGVLSGGKSSAPMASMRLKFESGVDTSVLPANQTGAIASGSEFPVAPSFRLSSTASHAVVGPANSGGRADMAARPATDFDENEERRMEFDRMRAGMSAAQGVTSTVSGLPHAGAAPGMHSDQDGAVRAAYEQTRARAVEILAQVSVVSGRTSAQPTPGMERDEDGVALAERAATLRRVSHILNELNRVAGVSEHGATPAAQMSDTEKMDRIMHLQSALAADTASVARISGSAAARPLDANVFGAPADDGLTPHDPDGRGASTTARERAHEGDVRTVERQGYSFEDSAPHAAHVGATVAQPTSSTSEYVVDGLRTTDVVEVMARAAAEAARGTAAAAEYAGRRGEDADFRAAPARVNTAPAQQNAGQRPEVARAAPAVGEIAGPIRQGNLHAAEAHRALGCANERAGSVATGAEIRTIDDAVTADREVVKVYIPPRSLGMTAPAPRVTVKPPTVQGSVVGRGTINPLSTASPMMPAIDTHRLSVRDALLGMRSAGLRRLR
jgi:hypothetical protein